MSLVNRQQIFLLSALLLAGISAGAIAQTLFKSTMPDGRVIYADKPAPGAVKVDPVTPDTSKAGLQTLTPGEAAAGKKAAAAPAKPAVAEKKAEVTTTTAERVSEAEQKLRAAELARDSGKEPLPGERQGTAGGASRLTDAYFNRQRKLESDVEQARAALEKTRAAR